MNSKRKVIAVCGSSSGVGKTTLVNYLASVIPNSTAFYFDSYESTTIYPENMFQKLVTGEEINPEDIRNNTFYEDLHKLSFGGSIVDPMNNVIQAAEYLIIEERFGNLRLGMKELIDFVICIDLPSTPSTKGAFFYVNKKEINVKLKRQVCSISVHRRKSIIL